MKFKRRPMKADVPTMAMGDIAFNLLIFFVILARAQDDSHLQWQAASASQLRGVSNSQVSVVIDNQNKLYFNGQQIGQAELAKRIADTLGETPAGQRTVLFKVHKEATALYYEPVIEAISEAGGDLVHILEDKRK
jgi:biopolymer transport protein ExbD